MILDMFVAITGGHHAVGKSDEPLQTVLPLGQQLFQYCIRSFNRVINDGNSTFGRVTLGYKVNGND